VCRVYRRKQHITGYFGDESFQSITCTGSDNLTINQETEHEDKTK